MIGDISSIATLVLFVFYFLGRFWTMYKNMKFQTEILGIDMKGIGNVDNPDFDLNGLEIVKLKSSENLSYVEVWECNYVEKKGAYRLIKTIKKCSRKMNIPKGKELLIKCTVPEGIPTHMVVFERFDGLRGSFAIGYDGRQEGNGVIAIDYRTQITFKALMYNILK